MTSTRTLVEEVVARGVDDWVHAAELLDIANGAGVLTPVDRRVVAIGLVAEVLIGGLMEAGSVTTGTGFNAWTCTAAEAVARVAQDWLSRPDPLVMPGEIMWLNNTPRGEARGAAVLARERQ